MDVRIIILVGFTFINSLFIVLYGQSIKEHPKSANVTEGTWANFSCTFKSSGHLQWRIGKLAHHGCDYNPSNLLGDIDGIAVNSHPINNTIYNTETIQILATEAMDGTPVECMFVQYGNYSSPKKVYSKFAILNVHKPSDFYNFTCPY